MMAGNVKSGRIGELQATWRKETRRKRRFSLSQPFSLIRISFPTPRLFHLSFHAADCFWSLLSAYLITVSIPGLASSRFPASLSAPIAVRWLVKVGALWHSVFSRLLSRQSPYPDTAHGHSLIQNCHSWPIWIIDNPPAAVSRLHRGLCGAPPGY